MTVIGRPLSSPVTTCAGLPQPLSSRACAAATRTAGGTVGLAAPHRNVPDTPSCSISEHFEGIDEIRPGNFVLYDVMQWQLGSCSADQIACFVACPIVSINKDRNELVVYGGGVHLSKEKIEFNSHTIYGVGSIIIDNNPITPDKNLLVTSLSQEHGIIKVINKDIEKYKIGDLIGIFPIHSCMTANLMKEYYTISGDKIDHLAKNSF